MTDHDREPGDHELEDENREKSPPEAVAPPEGQQQESHESEDTLSPDEKGG
jgi:hypothetical protein